VLASVFAWAQQQGPLEAPVQTTTKPKAAQSAPPAKTTTRPKDPAADVPFKPEERGGDASGEDTPVFRSEVRLVRMLATVRDAQGGIAGNLARSDFRITDNGVAQEIALFEATTAQPLSVALLIDCSRSTQREHRTELDAVRTFAHALLRGGNEGDTAALYSFNSDVTLEARWTRAFDQIDRALGRLRSESATALYDAVRFASEDLAGRPGRHVAIIVSDGGDTFSHNSFQQALEAAHAADAIIFSVIVVPVEAAAGRNTGGENALITLSNSTGGRAFFPATNAELDTAFDAILRALRTQYLLAFYPRDVKPTQERFHEVRLTVNRPGYSADCRRGYFEPAPAHGFKPVGH
jgi:Ca-activated chloride channel family protein